MMTDDQFTALLAAILHAHVEDSANQTWIAVDRAEAIQEEILRRKQPRRSEA